MVYFCLTGKPVKTCSQTSSFMPNCMMMFVVSFQIERDKLLKEQQAHEEAVREKEELERRLQEFQEEANRAKDALVGEIQNKQASKQSNNTNSAVRMYSSRAFI